MINIIKDIDLIEHVKDYDCVLVSANIYGTMSNGFQFDVKQNYPYVLKENIKQKYGDVSRLGSILEVKSNNKPTFCLCYFFKNVTTRPDINNVYVNYEALETCLKFINIIYKGKKIASTIMGSTPFDGNGDKEKILEIFNKTLVNVNVDIYDFVEDSKKVKYCKAYHKGQEIKKKDKEEYKKFLVESKNNFKRKI